MELTEQRPSRDIKDMVRDRLRRDLPFLVFFMSPSLSDFHESAEWLAGRHKVSVESAEGLKRELLRSGFWSRTADGRLFMNHRAVGLWDSGAEDVLSPSEFMTMASQLLVRMTTTGPCWAEFQAVATTEDIKREFLSDISLALRKLLETSRSTPATTVFFWNHMTFDAIKYLATSPGWSEIDEDDENVQERN